MKKLYLSLLLLAVIGLSLGVFNKLNALNNVTPVPLAASNPNTAPQTLGAVQKPQDVSTPVSFTIPKLNVRSVTVESVGLDKEGKMDIPKDENNVAWYNLGSKPGERGNSVIAAHYDKKSGEPAVFYEINKLQKGDELKVKAKDGQEYTYAVTEVKSYELADFPLIEVFGVGDRARLNLITCEGNYDKASKLYSHRLVVYSELKT
ncbi:MAG: class F sortase [bacterium]|nr:class F sortase [bacterium]